MLCLGFSMRIMLATRGCFNCCYVVLALSQGLLSFPYSAGEQVHKKSGDHGHLLVGYINPTAKFVEYINTALSNQMSARRVEYN